MGCLYDDLEEFARDHESHGASRVNATKPAWNGYLLTVGCRCGVVFERWVTPEGAVDDLVWSRLGVFGS